MYSVLKWIVAASFGVVLAAPVRADRGPDAAPPRRAAARPAPARPAPPAHPPETAPPGGFEEERRIPAIFEEIFPDRAKRLREQGRDHPEWFRRTIRRAHQVARELEELKETNLQEFDRRVKQYREEAAVEEQADVLRAAKDEAAKAPLRRILRAHIETLFDMKEQTQRDRVDRMQQELKTLQERLDRRHQSRQGIIDRRMRELEEGEELEF